MKGKSTSTEERQLREAQAKRYKSEEWIRVTFSNGNTRMVKRADYEAAKKAQA